MAEWFRHGTDDTPPSLTPQFTISSELKTEPD